LIYHRDIAEDRSELKLSRKKLWFSFIFVISFIWANVNDERSGGSTDIANEEGTVLLGAIKSCDKNSDATKNDQNMFNKFNVYFILKGKHTWIRRSRCCCS